MWIRNTGTLIWNQFRGRCKIFVSITEYNWQWDTQSCYRGLFWDNGQARFLIHWRTQWDFSATTGIAVAENLICVPHEHQSTCQNLIWVHREHQLTCKISYLGTSWTPGNLSKILSGYLTNTRQPAENLIWVPHEHQLTCQKSYLVTSWTPDNLSKILSDYLMNTS